MFGIGEFAGLGRVSVRMLRHYDAIGLLRPAHVDPHTGYRRYAAAQLRTLNRVVALKELGFSLQQVQTMLDDKVGPGELRGMLRSRRAELAAQVERDNARLAQVDARLRSIEGEGSIDTGDVVLKPIPPVRVAVLSAFAASYDDPQSISENLTPLYARLMQLMDHRGVASSGAPLAYYLPAPAGPGDERIRVHAAFPVPDDISDDSDFSVIVLPAVERAASALHHGPMFEAFRTGQKLATWIDENGYAPEPPGMAREIYLEIHRDDLSRWVTEMQVPVRKATEKQP